MLARVLLSIRHSSDTPLEPKTQANPGVSRNRAESVLEIFVVEQVLDGTEQAKAESIVAERKRISGGQIDPTISLESICVLRELRGAKDGREVRARRKHIPADPEAFNSLRHDDRHLMTRDPE